MSDEKLQKVADSALLRVLQYVVTGLMIPLAVFLSSRALNQLDAIQAALTKADKDAALYELRLQAVERGNAERDTAIRLLTENSLRHDWQLKDLQQRQPSAGTPAGTPPR